MNPDAKPDVANMADGDSKEARLAVAQDSVHALWLDDRGGAGNEVWFRSSADRGANWKPADVRLDHRMGGKACRSGLIAADWNDVYAVWIDDRTGADEIWINGSQDRGETWRGADTPVGQ